MRDIRLEWAHWPAKGQTAGAPPLLFVHGAFSGLWCWEANFLPWFAERGFDVWAVSLEGHAGSSGHERLARIGISDYVDNLQQAIDRIGQPPIIVGHSMGGYVTQALLSRGVELPGVIMLAAVPPYGLTPSVLRLLGLAPGKLMKVLLFQQGVYQPSSFELRHLLFSPAAPESATALMASREQRESYRAMVDMMLWPVLPPLRALPPALVLGSTLDQIVMAPDVYATAMRFGVAPVFFPGMGHMMMLDQGWQDVAETMANWLQTQWPAPAPAPAGTVKA